MTLRERTGAGIMDCKRALENAGGDVARAEEALKGRGLALAAKKAGRETSQGLVETYIHGGGRIGAMVEVSCETDFVARTPEFRALAHDIALQVAAMAPLWIGDDDAPAEADSSKGEPRLLYQPFIRDQGKTIRDLITEAVARVGENVRVRRFARFELGT